MAGKYVVMGDNGKYAVSSDGITWSTFTADPSLGLEYWGTVGDDNGPYGWEDRNWGHTAVYDYENRIYLAVGYTGGDYRVLRSVDGITWFDSGISTTDGLLGASRQMGLSYASGVSVVSEASGGFTLSNSAFSNEAGTNITTSTSLSTDIAPAITGGGSKWFATNNNELYTLSNPDFDNDTVSGTLEKPTPFGSYAIAYSNIQGRLVSFIDGEVTISDDLGATVSNTTQVTDMVRSYTIFRGKSEWFAAGAAYVDPDDPSLGYENRLAVSLDGLIWSPVTPPAVSGVIYHFRPGSDGLYTIAGDDGLFALGNPTGSPAWQINDTGLSAGETIRVMFSSFPVVETDEYITVGADIPEYTTEQDTSIQATLRYEAPVETGQDSLMLYRISKDYRWASDNEEFPAMPKNDNGRPFYEDIYDPEDSSQTLFSTQPGVLPYRDEDLEPWGRIAVFISGKDVTFFRGAPTSIESISWQSFGNFEAASFYLPAITQYDKLGESVPTTSSGVGGGILPGALEWLTDDAAIDIRRIKPDGSLETLWLGTVNGLDLDMSGVGLRVTAHGLLYEANHQILPGDIRSSELVVPRDTGIVAAEVLNSLSGEWSYAEPLSTGVSTVKSPNWDNPIDFLRGLNSIGSPEIWIDTDYKPYVTGRPDINPDRRYNTFDVIAGQGGVELSLQYDAAASPTVIYGQGQTSAGVQWRNVFYPAVKKTPYELYRFPFDDPDETLKPGAANYDTASGTGVSGLRNLLQQNAYLSPFLFPPPFRFNTLLEDAVRAAQEDLGLEVTGEVDAVLWSRLLGIADVLDDSFIEPLYVSPLIDPNDPSYDPSVRRVEQFIDFGSNTSRGDARDIAQKTIERDMIKYTAPGFTPEIWKQRKSVTGSVSMTIDPIERVAGGDSVSRWDLKPGDSIRIIPHIFSPIVDDKHDSEPDTSWEGGDSGGSLLLYIKKVEWSFTDTPRANLTVSTRDLEFNELDAAQARVRVSNAEKAIDQKAKKASGKTAGS